MYFIILATMLTNTNAAPLPMPSIMGSYETLEKCRDELIFMADNNGFRLTKHPMFGKSAAKQYGKEGVTVFFCARDMRSI